MKHITLLLFCFIELVVSPITVSAQYNSCVVPKDIPPVASNCSCSEGGSVVLVTGNCPDWQYDLNGYVSSETASSGYQSSTSSSKFIGNKFQCTAGFNTTRLTWCRILSNAAGVTCGATCVTPPVCIACFAGAATGWALSCQGCSIVTCNLAVSGTPVNVISQANFVGKCPLR